jgi:hypothetical protein
METWVIHGATLLLNPKSFNISTDMPAYRIAFREKMQIRYGLHASRNIARTSKRLVSKWR